MEDTRSNAQVQPDYLNHSLIFFPFPVFLSVTEPAPPFVIQDRYVNASSRIDVVSLSFLRDKIAHGDRIVSGNVATLLLV